MRILYSWLLFEWCHLYKYATHLECSEPCITCNQTMCTACPYNMYLDSYANCRPCMGLCASCSYESPATCIFCFPGYYLSSSNLCVKYSLLNCSVYANVNSCLVCIDHFYLLNGVCYGEIINRMLFRMQFLQWYFILELHFMQVGSIFNDWGKMYWYMAY